MTLEKTPTVTIVESEMSVQSGQEKKLLRGQIIIAKVTLERAPTVAIVESEMSVHAGQETSFCEDK